MSVNIGARHLQAADFMPRLRAALARHPDLGPGALELEVLRRRARWRASPRSRASSRPAHASACPFAPRRFPGRGIPRSPISSGYPRRVSRSTSCSCAGWWRDAEDLAIPEGDHGAGRCLQARGDRRGGRGGRARQPLAAVGLRGGAGLQDRAADAGGRIPAWVANWSPPAAWRQARA